MGSQSLNPTVILPFPRPPSLYGNHKSMICLGGSIMESWSPECEKKKAFIPGRSVERSFYFYFFFVKGGLRGTVKNSIGWEGWNVGKEYQVLWISQEERRLVVTKNVEIR